MDCIRKIKDTASQKTRANSYHQVRNLLDAFEVDQAAVRPGPALLIDDVVDSGWTFTVLTELLCKAGSGPVRPFALADSSLGDSN